MRHLRHYPYLRQMHNPHKLYKNTYISATLQIFGHFLQSKKVVSHKGDTTSAFRPIGQLLAQSLHKQWFEYRSPHPVTLAIDMQKVLLEVCIIDRTVGIENGGIDIHKGHTLGM